MRSASEILHKSFLVSLLVSSGSAIVVQLIVLALYHNAPVSRGEGLDITEFVYIFLIAPVVENILAIFFVEFFCLIFSNRSSVALVSLMAGLIHIFGKQGFGYATLYFVVSVLSFSIYISYYLKAKQAVGSFWAFIGSLLIHFATNVAVLLVLVVHAFLI